MSRILLISPPCPEPRHTPLLGLQYIAASLLAGGCEVGIIDAGAARFEHDEDWIVTEARRFRPDIIGMGLYTRWALHVYRLAARLRDPSWLLVAGGPHATARPFEPLHRHFDVAVVGEAERVMLRLAGYVDGQTSLDSVPGIVYRSPNGKIASGPPREFIADLDSLPFPHLAQDLFDPAWYGDSGQQALSGGMLTARGCAARCTFCANQVTGRRFRFRSPANVTAELNALHQRSGLSCFAFWDESVSARPARFRSLMSAFDRDLRFRLYWTAMTRANLVAPELLRTMKRSGCVAVNFGVESGDDGTLARMGKGVTTEQVVQALEWSKEAGLRTSCSFILGYPGETAAELSRTLAFMERIAPLTDSFGTLGVLVPFPGTPVYEHNHERFGFTDWWLREEHSRFEPMPEPADPWFHTFYAGDPTLEADFFRYSPEVKDLIRACLRFKAEHNLRMMRLTP